MRAAKADANQREIVAALRAIGCSVVSLHRVGAGVPDLLVGRNGITYLVEVKIPGEKLNTIQREWHAKWRGSTSMIWTCREDVLHWASHKKP